MDILSVIKLLSAKISGLIKKRADMPCEPTLMSVIESARRDWQQALKEMNHIDGELSDYVIFKINSAERHYMMLLKQAKQEGVTAWPAVPGKIAPTTLNTHP
ncbi:YaaL family protein [Pelotomaculum isophthalicicum JI]|uniref:YaaL family protein n=1 Tax=Pelotomaculum isophthalicicum JI TaxID=947010 RepID=A0A9X4H6K2_9FIRM|nr:DUF2508 family protein [Pelotomaculum isophthalicicum]MDF9406994.1 YaaL family protein [Pelotomaculum isophthalicicum JI]